MRSAGGRGTWGGGGTLGLACSAGTASAPVDVLPRVVTGRQALSDSVGTGRSPEVLGGWSRAPCCGRIALQAPGRAEPEGVGQAAWPRVSGADAPRETGITVFAPVLGAQVLELPGFLPLPQPCRAFFQFLESPVCEIAERAGGREGAALARQKLQQRGEEAWVRGSA